MTDKDNKLYRIIKESSQPNDSVFDYEFYYKDKKLIFAKMIMFSNKLSEFDTIVNSEMYYKNEKLIEQLNKKPKGIDAEYVKLFAESFTVEGLVTE